MLKLVPATTVLQGIVNRIEYVGVSIPTFLSTFGPPTAGGTAAKDVVYLAYAIWKRALRRFAGSNNGVSISSVGQSYITTEPLCVHLDDSFIDFIKIPEPIMKFIDAQMGYLDKRGSILPVPALVNLSAITTGATYTGPGKNTAVWPTNLPSQRYVGNVAAVLSLWKPLERSFAQYSNMQMPGALGRGSLLDTTLLVDPNALFLTGIVSRRLLGEEFISKCLSVVDALSYTAVAQTAADISLAGNNPLFYDHTYSQKSRRVMGGYDSLAVMATAAEADGFVLAGTLASNIQGNDGPDFNSASSRGNDDFIASPVPGPDGPRPRPSNRLESPLKSLRDALVPRKGKYCGPGYSAGEFGNDQEMVGGKFLVPPDGPEDAICKTHDEDYVAADGDPDKIREADARLVRSFNRLEQHQGLSPYAKAARAWFQASNNNNVRCSPC